MNENVLEEKKDRFVEVSIVTTSGSYPGNGFDRVPAHQKIHIQLDQAAKDLKIADTRGWLATVNGRELNINASYLENGLEDQIEIDFGPREGGGGYA